MIGGGGRISHKEGEAIIIFMGALVVVNFIVAMAHNWRKFNSITSSSSSLSSSHKYANDMIIVRYVVPMVITSFCNDRFRFKDTGNNFLVGAR